MMRMMKCYYAMLVLFLVWMPTNIQASGFAAVVQFEVEREIENKRLGIVPEDHK